MTGRAFVKVNTSLTPERCAPAARDCQAGDAYAGFASVAERLAGCSASVAFLGEIVYEIILVVVITAFTLLASFRKIFKNEIKISGCPHNLFGFVARLLDPILLVASQ